MDTLFLAKVVAVFLLLPGINLVLAMIGLMSLHRHKNFGITLLVTSLVTLYGFSTPMVENYLWASLEEYPALSAETPQRNTARAIVVLAGGRFSDAPEYGGDTVSSTTLSRIRYAAHLYRQTKLSLLLTGGVVFGEGIPEAVLMKEVLENEFKVPVAWVETEARNTQENASFTRDILVREGITGFFLVTNAGHMPRAMESFRRLGLEPIPAPTQFTSSSAQVSDLFSWLPNAGSLESSNIVFNEYLGRIWYWLRY